jgi:Domain of unknown function (DUF2357)/PD-(D/E)XK nuclease superfamily
VLTIKARRPGCFAEQREDRLVLQGEVDWLVEGPPEELGGVDQALHGISERLSNGLRLLNFHNAVGFFEVPGLGRIEVISSKWTQEDCHRLLADLTKVASPLPFSARAAAALPYDRSVIAREDVLYHAFVYLRHALSGESDPSERLVPALNQIVYDPHRRFTPTTAPVHLDVARRVEVGALAALAAGRFPLTKLPIPSSLPLARALRQHLPERIDETRVEATVDTPENRFVKSFLHLVGGIAQGLRRVIQAQPPHDAFAERLLKDCDEFERALEPIVRHPVWRDVGPMVHLPASSTVLQRRRGYREVYRVFAKLSLATQVALPPSTVRDLLELKDVALLYELWSYFTLVNHLTRLLGRPTFAEGASTTNLEMRVRWGIRVEWAGRARLVYSPPFSAKEGRRRSYSVPLRPDIGLEIVEGINAGWHFFDAKFRVQRLDDVMPSEEQDYDADLGREDERQGTFKLADLYKMHTYRDAIEGARSVWILYPGTEYRFFTIDGTRLDPSDDTLSDDLQGVGALPLLPTDKSARPQRVLRALIGRWDQ